MLDCYLGIGLGIFAAILAVFLLCFGFIKGSLKAKEAIGDWVELRKYNKTIFKKKKKSFSFFLYEVKESLINVWEILIALIIAAVIVGVVGCLIVGLGYLAVEVFDLGISCAK